jgi:hypothetical protein
MKATARITYDLTIPDRQAQALARFLRASGPVARHAVVAERGAGGLSGEHVVRARLEVGGELDAQPAQVEPGQLAHGDAVAQGVADVRALLDTLTDVEAILRSQS